MLIYQSKIHDLTAVLVHENPAGLFVDLTLGSETRRFSLGEFTNFWLTMVEEGRKATTAYLDSLGHSPLPKLTRKR